MGHHTAAELFDLTGRVAIVSGGGTHLGRAMAEALAACGAHVTIAGRRADVVDAAAGEMRDAGWSCESMTLDVTDHDATEAAVAQLAERHGRVDIAVCNAGASFEHRYPPDTDLEALRATFESHVVGTVNLANAAARVMLTAPPARCGSIITVSSIHGFLAADPRLYDGLASMSRRSSLAYQTAKAAILGVTRNLAAEYGRRGIRVNCISPGQIPKAGADPAFVERAIDTNALGVCGAAEDVRGAVVLLASDAGRFITGHNLVIDGGWSIW